MSMATGHATCGSRGSIDNSRPMTSWCVANGSGNAAMLRNIAISTLLMVLPIAASAEGLLPTHRIPAELASQAVAEAVASLCRSRVTPRPLCWLMPTACGRRYCVAIGPAAIRSIARSTRPTHRPRSRATPARCSSDRRPLRGFANLFTQLPHLILFGGGVVIKVGDEVVGAIGAAGAPGANLDEACARAGVDKIRDQLK